MCNKAVDHPQNNAETATEPTLVLRFRVAFAGGFTAVHDRVDQDPLESRGSTVKAAMRSSLRVRETMMRIRLLPACTSVSI